MKVEKFKAAHFWWLSQQPGHEHLCGVARGGILQAIEAAPYTYTVFGEGDRVLMCCGVVQYWEGRGELFANLNRDCKKEFLRLHHVAKELIWSCPVTRLEAAVEVDFENGHRWVSALGFTKEADLVRKYLPNGKDCTLYARILNG